MPDIKSHPQLAELAEQHRQGRVSRREFLRLSALVGVSVGAATIISPWSPSLVRASAPRRGGMLKVASAVHKISNPVQISWGKTSNILRQVAEYLTITGTDNITRPLLAKDWQASDDLKTWTFNLRQGIKFNNGDDFTADDVFFTLKMWLDEEAKSSMLGLVGSYLSPEGIEKTGQFQIKLHLKRPEIGLPEHFFHYPAFILNHRTFEGDFLKAPHGTGPYTLEMYKETEIAILKARNDYWQKGADGKPLPYLDGMTFMEIGSESAPQLAALKSGEIDMIDLADAGSPDIMLAARKDPNLVVKPVTTSQVRVLRMRTDKEPWTDNRVRQAIKHCQRRDKILKLAYFDEGMTGQDFHVYPNHPEYCLQPTPEYNPEKARALLKEAGYPDGLKVELNAVSYWSDVMRFAEILKEDAKPARLDIDIKAMPVSQYWEKWTEVGLGITPWTHRALGTMVLNLAFGVDAQGQPVAWNETRWVDQEFNHLLNNANGTLDVIRRKEIFCKLEKIQQERGSIGIPFWQNLWMVTNKKLKGVKPHPNLYMLFNEAYLEG
ncbi:MAG: ABC transporter substrate-binding protein [Desulfotignum sp.]